MTEADHKEALRSWFVQGDEAALATVYTHLAHQLSPTPQVIRLLGREVAAELRQDVLFALLNRQGGHLRGAEAPLAYARTVWRRKLADQVRRHVRRSVLLASEAAGQAVDDEHSSVSAREVAWDVQSALSHVERLPWTTRMAILLTTSPHSVTPDDWHRLGVVPGAPPATAGHPPLDREEASLLLYPPDGPEGREARARRRGSFDRAYSRGVASLREAMGGEAGR